MTRATVLVRADTRTQSVCRSCGAPLTWYRTLERDKGMPFDGDPDPIDTSATVSDGRPVAELPADAVHWRTCPQAADWRKRQPNTRRTRR